MIVCKASEPKDVDGWRRVVDLEPCVLPPEDEFAIEEPDWKEHVVERTLLRRPDVLAETLGLQAAKGGLLALRQVARIDLYLRGGSDLHLLELKRPRAYGQWLFAVEQIVRQWCAAAAWLRREGESVHLWAVVPVRWSLRTGKPKVPSDWSTALSDITRTHLIGSAAAEVCVLFYVVVRSSTDRFLLFWRVDEEAPNVRWSKGSLASSEATTAANTPVGAELQSDSARLEALVSALRARPGQAFRAAELKKLTGIPKSVIRRLLADVGGVSITEHRPYYFSWPERADTA